MDYSAKQYYEIFNKYFNTLVFNQVETKNNFAIYAAHVHDGLASGSRYVYLLVPQHLAFQKKARIGNLPWKVLQTRTARGGYRLPMQAWKLPEGISDVKLNIVRRERMCTIYGAAQFPFEIQLLHDGKKKDCTGLRCSVYQYLYVSKS